MMKQQTTKLTITLTAIIIVAAAITPIKPLVFAQTESNSVKTLRIGYFPNINHAQAVIGLGNGDFQKALGDNIKVQQLYLTQAHLLLRHYLPKRLM